MNLLFLLAEGLRELVVTILSFPRSAFILGVKIQFTLLSEEIRRALWRAKIMIPLSRLIIFTGSKNHLLNTLSRFAASSSMTDDTEFCFLSTPGGFGTSRVLEASLARSSVGFYRSARLPNDILNIPKNVSKINI